MFFSFLLFSFLIFYFICQYYKIQISCVRFVCMIFKFSYVYFCVFSVSLSWCVLDFLCFVFVFLPFLNWTSSLPCIEDSSCVENLGRISQRDLSHFRWLATVFNWAISSGSLGRTSRTSFAHSWIFSSTTTSSFGCTRWRMAGLEFRAFARVFNAAAQCMFKVFPAARFQYQI